MTAVRLNELKGSGPQPATDGTGKPRIIVGMGTCGIAAGARKILQAIMQEVESRRLDVLVTQTGCIGMCQNEPLLDVQLPGGPRITYGNVAVKDVSRIIASHVMGGRVVEESGHSPVCRGQA